MLQNLKVIIKYIYAILNIPVALAEGLLRDYTFIKNMLVLKQKAQMLQEL